MHKRRIGVIASLIIVALIYVVFSIIGGATGELLLHLNSLNANYFREGVIAVFLLLFLYYFNQEDIFSNQNIKWGFGTILVTILMTLTLNNDFSYLSFRFSYIYIAVLVGLFEEVFFRGIIFYFIDYFSLNPWKKVICKIYLSTIIFSLAHMYNIISVNQSLTQTIIQVLYAFCLGSVFAISYIMTKNILFSVAAHSISDLLSGMIGKQSLVTNVDLNLTNIICMLILVILTIVVNYFGLKGARDV